MAVRLLLILDTLSVSEPLNAGTFESAHVNEDIARANIWGDQAETLKIVEKLDGPGVQNASLSVSAPQRSRA